ncbi:MAG: ATPase domain-containing protein [Candidatus Parvarchaeum sp.]
MEIKRVKSGIFGLDEKMEGGFEEGSIIAVVGGPGSGKSILGMQFLNQGLSENQKCLYLSFEESKEDILKDMNILGMKPDIHVKNGNFIVIEASPVNFEYLPILDTLKEKKINRLVIDSLSAISIYLNDISKFRKLILELVTELKKLNITTIAIDEQPQDQENGVKYFSGEYLADSVIMLYYTGLGGDFDRSMQIIKMRRTNNDRSMLPMKIDKGGIHVK